MVKLSADNQCFAMTDAYTMLQSKCASSGSFVSQVMDFGYPQFTEAKILSEYIKTDAHKMEVSSLCHAHGFLNTRLADIHVHVHVRLLPRVHLLPTCQASINPLD